MRTLFNLVLAVSLALQGFSGFSFQNIANAQNLEFPQNVTAEMEKLAPVPLLADVLKNQQTNTPETYSPSLRLKADPQLIIPGEPVSVEWTVGQWNMVSKKENLKAIVQFPNDVTTTEIATLTRGESNTSMVLPQAAANGKAGFNVNSQNISPFLIDVQIKAGDQEIAANSVLMTPPSLTALAGKDNHLVSRDGKVELDFPAKSLTQSLYLDVRDPSPSSIAGYSMSGRPVEVVAVGETTKRNVNEFDSDFKISIYYDIEALYGGAEDDLTIFYYDEDTNDWWPVQTTVDKKNRKLTAEVDHLTVFDYKAASWQGARLPTIDQAQVSGNTGAATYDMSFWLPPAQGGFSPSLSVSYNSQVVDSSTAFSQASLVGMGWSLDTGYIERNMHGTNTDLSDDTYQLILGGVSNTLLPISTAGTVTTYATSEMNYWSIKFDSSTDSWTLKDQAGTTYVFGFQTKTNASTSCVTNSTYLNLTWRWSLTSATDKFSNAIVYEYINQKKTSTSTCLNQVAVYPTIIKYPNDRYRIEFVLETRTDYQTSWEANDSKIFFQYQRLDKILVKHNPSGSTWNTIRQYDFTYSATTTNQIYPDFRWTKGGTTAGLTSTLVGVQELSGDGSANLPATEFTYGNTLLPTNPYADRMHLTKVDNKQGGTVTFNYERWTFLDDENDDLWSLYTVFGQHECSSTVGTAWYAMSGYGTTKCEAYMLQIDKRTASVGVGLRAFPQHIIKQGAQYRLYIQARNIYQTTGLEWGFTDPNGGDVEGIANGIGSTLTDFEVGGEMKVNLNPLSAKFIIECDNCYIKKLQFMMMPLFYRVTSKVVEDSATSTSGTYTYNYNDGANNDIVHSEASNRTGTKYTPVLRNYRGYSQVQVKNPDGLVTTTWYYQNDLLGGRPYRTLTSTLDESDEFKTLDTGKWTFSHAGTRQQIGKNLAQETWLNSTTTAADWTTVTNRSAYSLTDGDVMYTQFKVSGANTQTLLGITSTAGDFFGGYAVPNGTSHDLNTFVNINGTPVVTMLIPASTFKRDTWYEAMIFVDANDGFQLRVWEKYNPTNYFESSSTSPNGAVDWCFINLVYNGTVLLDSYLEGVPYAETEMSYQSSVLYDTLSNGIPNLTSLTSFVDLQVNRSTTSAVVSRFFDGDYSWTGTKTAYEYNTADQGGTQYGNLTRTVESSWNGAGWSDYRASKVEYNPNATANLTTLPARSITLDCASGCDFTNETGKTSEMLYLYDNASSASLAPSTGVLTAQRSWVENNNYSQAAYTYDTHGNPITTTTWSGFGTATAAPTAGARTTTTAFDTYYLTYPISVTNVLNQVTQTAYNYVIGQPTSVTDANNVTTTAQYDSFGRMVKIVAPGDSDGSPTLTIAYHDTRIPFQVDLNQKVNSSGAAIRISRFYSGLGQQIQTQMVGSIVNGVQKNTVTDVKYDTAGRAIKETKPYTINYNGSPVFLAQTFTQALTQTTYDILNRPTSVTLPNGNSSSYAYNGLTTSVIDPANKVTVSYKDDWGRVIAIDAPTGPGLVYAYNSSDLLTSVQKGSGGSMTETVLTYNQAGQKTAMDDPDMGAWSYGYDALGNLVSQADARNCATTLTYDALNRLTGKSFSGAGACATTASISYTYDSGTYAIGQRSGMEDGSGSTSWTYDSRGRKSSEVKTIGSLDFTTSWTYNSADQPVTMTYPDGELLTYGYNSQGLLNSLANNDNFTYLSSMNYDEAGRMTQVNLGSGSLLQKAFSYYSWSASVNGGNLNTMTTTNAASNTLQDFDYTYDMRGNIAQIIDGVSSETSAFSYDDLSRLTAMNVTSGGTTVHSEAFTYNPDNGNLNGKGADLDSLVNYIYSTNQPHALTAYGSNAYTYDANGNQVTRQIGSNEFDLTFDAENHLVEVQSNEPFPTESYTWEPFSTPAITDTPTPTATPTETLTPTTTSAPVTAQVIGQCGPFTSASASVDIPAATTMLIVVEGGSNHGEPTAYAVGGHALTLEVENDKTTREVRIYSKNLPPTGTQTITLTGFTPATYGAAWGCYYLTGTDTTNPIRSVDFVNGSEVTELSISRVSAVNDIVIDVLGLMQNTTSIQYNCAQSSGYSNLTNRTASGYKVATGSSTDSCYLFNNNYASIASIAIKSAPLPTATPAITETPTPTTTATETFTPSATSESTAAQVIGQCGPLTSENATVSIPTETTLLVVVEGGSTHSVPTSYTVGGQALTRLLSISSTRLYILSLPPTGEQTISLTGFAPGTGAAWGCYFLSGTDTSSPIRDSGISTFIGSGVSMSLITQPDDVIIDVLGLANLPTSINYNCGQSFGYLALNSYTASGYLTAFSTSTNSCYLFNNNSGNLLSIAIKSAPLPTATPTNTFTPTATETHTPTLTPTASNTPTITETPTPTNTLEPSPTVPSNTPTDTETPTETATVDPLITPTETPTATATVDPLITATETMTPTITDTPTETFTPTITLTPSDTPVPSDTPTPSETPTPTETATETATATSTSSPTATATAVPIPGEAQYVYDGDGNVVKSVIGDVTTYYAGSTYEKKVVGIEQVERKYYFAGSSRIAMRENGTITWLLSDNLGSTSTTAAADGSLLDVVKYTAFGEIRDGATATDYRYTGQRDEFEIGLYYYVARYYDPVIGRFISADTIIPTFYNPKAWDRYSYVMNSPINFIDPSGHMMSDFILGSEWEGYGPTRIINAYVADDNRRDEALRDFTRDHPEYNAATDLTLGDNYLFYQVAKFQAQVQDDELNTKDAWNLAFAGLAFSDIGEITGNLGAAASIIKKGPNPFGKKGGLLHQSKIDSILDDLDAIYSGKNVRIRKEIGVDTVGGVKSKRYGDIGVLDEYGGILEIYQVGKINKNGLPVARERIAINDLQQYGGVHQVHFVPYNQ